MTFRTLLRPALLALTLLTACTHPAENAPPTSPGPTHTTARYECPMGCKGSESRKPGKCPVCEMDLEEKRQPGG